MKYKGNVFPVDVWSSVPFYLT